MNKEKIFHFDFVGMIDALFSLLWLLAKVAIITWLSIYVSALAFSKVFIEKMPEMCNLIK